MLPPALRKSLHWGLTQLSAGLAVIYLITALVTTLPGAVPFKNQIRAATGLPFRFLGLWQDWSMFSPNPLALDIYTSAHVTFADGSTSQFNLSRMIEMPLWERYKKERWRKYLNDNLRLDAHQALWKPFAIWLASEASRESGQAVTRIALLRHWNALAGPDEPHDPTWNEFRFFTWDFQKVEKS